MSLKSVFYYSAQKFLMGSVGLSFCLASTLEAADDHFLADFEAGQVMATHSGDSVKLQVLVNQDPQKLKEAAADLTKLVSLLGNSIAFSRLYTDSSSKKNPYIYLKIRGLGDGVGILMRVQKPGITSFANAFPLSLAVENTVNTTVEHPTNLILEKLAETNSKNILKRTLSSAETLVLEGPVEAIPQYPNLHVVLSLGFGGYMITRGEPKMPAVPNAQKLTTQDDEFDFEEAAELPNIPVIAPAVATPKLSPQPINLVSERSYLLAEINFSVVKMKGEVLNDYRGLLDNQILQAESLSQEILGHLKTSLEKF